MPPSRRDELIEAAMRVFSRHGFHSTNIDKVLQAGGISRMTLYNHFKSKDELIIASLRRRDEIFRNQLMMFVDRASDEPMGRLMAVFDFLERWLGDTEFSGCMFINACAEFADPNCAVRRLAAEHKTAIVRYLRELCIAAELREPDRLAVKLGILLDGAAVAAQVVGQVGSDGTTTAQAAAPARDAARQLIELARAA